MTTARQPGLPRAASIRGVPGDVRDPQTTQEQATRPERIAMSGVQADGAITQDAAYQNYLILLNNSGGAVVVARACTTTSMNGLVRRPRRTSPRRRSRSVATAPCSMAVRA